MTNVRTFRKHFDEDIARAFHVQAHAASLAGPEELLAQDLLRSAVVIAVGAMDAYLCDLYVDLLSSSTQALSDGRIKSLPKSYKNVRLPIGALFGKKYSARPNWALRMAAREIMERENMQQVRKISGHLNPALPSTSHLWNSVVMDYVKLNRKRLTRLTTKDFIGMNPKVQKNLRGDAAGAMISRIEEVVQRRHDIVHNCDRPKTALQHITASQAKKMVTDIRDFVVILDDHVAKYRVV